MKSYPVANRAQYQVFILKIPQSSKKMRLSAANIILQGKYPVSMTDKTLVVLKNKGERDSWICFVCSNEMNPGTYISTTLVAQQKFPNYTGYVVIECDGMAELIEMENGGILSSHLLPRDGSHSAMEQAQLFLSDSDKICTEIQFSLDEKYTKNCLFVIGHNESLTKRILVITICTILAFTGIIISGFILNSKRQHELEERIKIEQQIEAQQRDNQAKQLELEQLKKEYSDFIESAAWKSFDVIQLLYACVGGEADISSISITSRNFQLDAFIPNSVDVLSNFERFPAIESIKLSKAVAEKNKEHVTFSGVLKSPIAELPKGTPIDESIHFYRSSIEEENKIKNLRKNLSVSQFIGNVRKLLNEHQCTEEYMQYIQNGTFIEFECSVSATSVALFRFLQAADRESPPYLFSSIRIRDTNSSRVKATLRFYTGIEYFHSEDVAVDSYPIFESLNIQPSDVGKWFSSPVVSPQPLKASISAETPIKRGQDDIPLAHHISYIGSGGSNQRGGYVFVKNNETGKIYKLPVKEALLAGSTAENYCVSISDTSFYVSIDSRIFEVKK